MKIHHLLLANLLISASSPAIDDGVYTSSSSPTQAVELLTLDGRKLGVGEKLKSQGAAHVYSIDNWNENYIVKISVPDGAPGARDNLVIVHGGKAIDEKFLTAGPTVEGKGNAVHGFEIHGRKAAEDLSKKLGAPLMLRKPPQGQILVRFQPEKRSYAPNEKIVVRIVIRNLGTSPIYFSKKLRNLGPRCGLLEFVQIVQDDSAERASDVRSTNAQMSTVVVEELKPSGETYVEEDFSRWFNFKKAGAYKFLGACKLVLYPSLQGTDREDVIWDEYKAADFEISIKEPDSSQTRDLNPFEK